MGRACINELAQEIVNLQTQIALKDKDKYVIRYCQVALFEIIAIHDLKRLLKGTK